MWQAAFAENPTKCRAARIAMAFLSEVGAGSREENASKQRREPGSLERGSQAPLA
jgi:hypothetical protein